MSEGYAAAAEAGSHVLHIRGEIDLATAAQFEADVRGHALRVSGRLVLDLGDLTFMDARGARALARLAGSMGLGLPIVLRHPRPVIVWVLELTGLMASGCISLELEGGS